MGEAIVVVVAIGVAAVVVGLLAHLGQRAAVGRLVDLAGAHALRNTAELETKRQLIDRQLQSMNAQLDEVGRLIAGTERDRAESFGQLAGQLESVGQQTRRLSETTDQLRRALANGNLRGQWGERMASDVLRAAGFVEGVNYYRQRTLDNGRGRPDFTFVLPRDLLLHMDCKFPFDNYLRFAEADAKTDQRRYLRAFLRDVRLRVKELTERDYIDPASTVECVLLFIPNEQLYAFIQQHDPGIADRALASRVILCSPMTLFAVLAVVRQAVDNFTVEQTAGEILSLLGAFDDEWRKFCDALSSVGTHLDRAQRAYEQLAGPRRRQLAKPLDALADLRSQRAETRAEPRSATELDA